VEFTMLVPLMNATLMKWPKYLPTLPLVKSGGRYLPSATRMSSASQAPADPLNVRGTWRSSWTATGAGQGPGPARIEGHRRGVETVRSVTYAAATWGKDADLYAFSARTEPAQG